MMCVSVKICSRDEATLRRRSLSLTYRQRKRGLFSSLKGLDNLTKRGRDKRPSASQVLLKTPKSVCVLGHLYNVLTFFV